MVAVAMLAEFHVLPKMSFSPVRATPPDVTQAPPRAASSEPDPVAVVKDWRVCPGPLEVLTVRAAARLSSPAPCALRDWPVNGVAAVVNAYLTWSGVADGCVDR